MANNERPFYPVPKPESTKGKKRNKKTVERVVPIPKDSELGALPKAHANQYPHPDGEYRLIEEDKSKAVKERNERNRNFGKAVERQVAKMTGGYRTPMSGAIKNSNWNLTGDVEVKDADGRDFVKIEVKGTSTITPKGDKTFTLKKSVLDQAVKEAEDAREIGVVYLHWLNANYEKDDYVILKTEHFLRFLELAKVGASAERRTHED